MIILAGGAPAPEPAPSEPAAGYAAYFDPGYGTFQDYAGAVPAVADGDPIARWDSRGGSYPISVSLPGGYGAPHLKLGANGINGEPVVRSTAAGFDVLRDAAQAATFDGDLIALTTGTYIGVVRVPVIDGALVRGLWGDSNGLIGLRFYDFGAGPECQVIRTDAVSPKAVKKACSAGAAHVVTWHHEGGLLYVGVDDTRLGSMASVATEGDLVPCNFMVYCGLAGPGQYLDGDTQRGLFYPGGLDETGRKQSERYLAGLCAIALPY